MEDDKKTSIIIIIMGVLIIAVFIFLLLPTKKEDNELLEVVGKDVVFVGENGIINVNTDAKEIKVIYKNGFLVSSSIVYSGKNIEVPYTAKKAGYEEIEIKTSNRSKKLYVNVCDDFKLATNTINMITDSTMKLSSNLSDLCLSKYSFNIEDTSIATISNGIIYAKKAGLTTLTITRDNNKLTYGLKVGSREISFKENTSTIKVGESLTLEVIGADGYLECTSIDNKVSVTTSLNTCVVTGKSGGTATIIATSGDLKTTTNVEVKDVEVKTITLNPNVIYLNKGKTSKINIQVNEGALLDKNVTWSSSNTNIATVSNDGVVNAINRGVATITATTSNGVKATTSIIVTSDNMIASYDSSSLKYFITKGGTYYNISYIWVEDAYSQFKVAITSPKSSAPIPRNIEKADKIIDYMLSTNPSYSSKGFITINASAMVSSSYGKNAPANWFGTSQIPLILNDGKVIRDSSNEKISVDGDYIIYGLKSNGDLAYYRFTLGSNSAEKEANRNLFNQIKNDGVLYTFGFNPVLVSNKTVVASSNSPNIRQAICQVDKNNFIIVTNTNSTSNRDVGFGYRSLGELFVSLNCKTAFNLDGGGSTCLYYQKPNSNYVKVNTTYEGRGLSDMIYFIEK